MNIFGTHDENTIAQFQDVSSRAEQAALMADGHLGYVMPIGGVAGYDNKVSVVGVGFDIACGNCAIKTDLKVEDVFGLTLEEIRRNPSRFVDNRIAIDLSNQIFSELSFGIGGENRSEDAPIDDSLFYDDAWWILPNTGPQLSFRDDLMIKARRQLGTIGSGNHYVDVLAGTDGYLWVGVHFGSRGFGHTIASNFLALSQGGTWGDRGKEEEILLDLDSPLGHDYWELMQLAGRYAYAGREWVTRKVVSMLGGNEVDMVHNHHNFAWKEVHYLRELVVVRKGSTPAFPGQRGFVGGSMGDDAVILEGNDMVLDDPSAWYDTISRQKAAMYSTVHGAGRVMSRTEAKGKITKSGVVKRAGKISKSEMDEWLRNAGVVRKGGGLDEAPQAYRRLTDVLTSQGDTVIINETLKPMIVCMAPSSR